MGMLFRLLRSLWVVVRIFSSYGLQLGLQRLCRRRLPPRQRQTARRHRLPAWLKRRRQRVHDVNAQRLLDGILRQRGCYVKLGQVLSVMAGFLPLVYRTKLEQLQDAVPPRSFADMQDVFVRSLGKLPGAAFREIEDAPVAAASLGQVHQAYLKDGRKVAVKILYPRIHELIAMDMIVVRFALRLYQRFMPVANLEVVHSSLVDLLARETDYTHEARQLRRLAGNFSDRDDVLFPEVVDELSSKTVLTMTFMEGIKITHLERLQEEGIEPEAVAKLLLGGFAKQLLEDRYMHADPHPGNFMVQAGPSPSTPRLVMLDFGAVAEVQGELVEGLIDVLSGYFVQDGEQVLAGFYRMGFASEEGDQELLKETVLMYFERLLKVQTSPQALMDASPEALKELFDPELELSRLRELARSFRYPPGWFYIERSAVMMFGLVGTIAPQLDLAKVLYPHVMPLLMNRSAS